jgi:hypothetical protein
MLSPTLIWQLAVFMDRSEFMLSKDKLRTEASVLRETPTEPPGQPLPDRPMETTVTPLWRDSRTGTGREHSVVSGEGVCNEEGEEGKEG